MCVQSAAGPRLDWQPGSTSAHTQLHLEVAAHRRSGVSGQLFLHCGSGQPKAALGWMRGLRVSFSVNNDTILEECGISRIRHLELCWGEGDPGHV